MDSLPSTLGHFLKYLQHLDLENKLLYMQFKTLPEGDGVAGRRKRGEDREIMGRRKPLKRTTHLTRNMSMYTHFQRGNRRTLLIPGNKYTTICTQYQLPAMEDRQKFDRKLNCVHMNVIVYTHRYTYMQMYTHAYMWYIWI